MWRVIGQDHVLRQLESSLNRGRTAHAYLIAGPPHVGKMTLSIDLAQAANCLESAPAPCGSCTQCDRIARLVHPDVRVIGVGQSTAGGGRGSRTVIGIDDIKDVLRSVNLNPFEGSKKVIILDGAESMSAEAANALLKTLEEPPPQVMFLLLTGDADFVLPTISSRCQVFNLQPLAREEMLERLIGAHQASPTEAEQLYRYSRGCLGWAIRALDDQQVLEQRQADLERLQEAMTSGLQTKFAYANEVATLFSNNRDSAFQLLNLWLRWWRDLLLIKEGANEYLQNVDFAETLRSQAGGLSTGEIVGFIQRLTGTVAALERNASPRLALEVLMLNLPAERTRV